MFLKLTLTETFLFLHSKEIIHEKLLYAITAGAGFDLS